MHCVCLVFSIYSNFLNILDLELSQFGPGVPNKRACGASATSEKHTPDYLEYILYASDVFMKLVCQICQERPRQAQIAEELNEKMEYPA